MNNIRLLESQLRSLINEGDAERFILENKPKQEFHYFFEFLKHISQEKDIPMSKIVVNSRLNRNYVYNITSGTKKLPGRDKILALSIAAEMDFDEVDKALILGEKKTLDPYVPRDVWIAFCINNKVGDVLKVNLLLEEKGCSPLDL